MSLENIALRLSLVKLFNILLWFSYSLSLSVSMSCIIFPAAGCELEQTQCVCLGTHPSEAYHSCRCEILQELQRRDAGIHALSGWAVFKCATLLCRYFILFGLLILLLLFLLSRRTDYFMITIYIGPYIYRYIYIYIYIYIFNKLEKLIYFSKSNQIVKLMY